MVKTEKPFSSQAFGCLICSLRPVEKMSKTADKEGSKACIWNLFSQKTAYQFSNIAKDRNFAESPENVFVFGKGR